MDRQIGVSIPRKALAAWLSQSKLSYEEEKVAEQLRGIRATVNENLAKKEFYFCQKHGQFFVVPLSEKLWAVCQNDRRNEPGLREGLVVRTVLSTAAVSDKIDRCQWERVETQ